LTFRGFTIQVPVAWKIKKDRIGGYYVTTGPCRKRALECTGFSIGGPLDIHYASEGSPYQAGGLYHPSSGVQECVPDKRYFEGSTPQKPEREGKRPFGAGRKADFVEWKFACRTHTSKATSVSFTQRVWYLKSKRVLVVDQWKTPGLAGILKKAVWG
jgi:hypothetical protein